MSIVVTIENLDPIGGAFQSDPSEVSGLVAEMFKNGDVRAAITEGAANLFKKMGEMATGKDTPADKIAQAMTDAMGDATSPIDDQMKLIAARMKATMANFKGLGDLFSTKGDLKPHMGAILDAPMKLLSQKFSTLLGKTNTMGDLFMTSKDEKTPLGTAADAAKKMAATPKEKKAPRPPDEPEEPKKEKGFFAGIVEKVAGMLDELGQNKQDTMFDPAKAPDELKLHKASMDYLIAGFQKNKEEKEPEQKEENSWMSKLKKFAFIGLVALVIGEWISSLDMPEMAKIILRSMGSVKYLSTLAKLVAKPFTMIFKFLSGFFKTGDALGEFVKGADAVGDMAKTASKTGGLFSKFGSFFTKMPFVQKFLKAAKVATSGAGKMASKILGPLGAIGNLVSIYLGWKRISKASGIMDWVQGIMDIISGIAGFVPGVGALIAVPLDVINLLIDWVRSPEKGPAEAGATAEKGTGMFSKIGTWLKGLVGKLARGLYNLLPTFITKWFVDIEGDEVKFNPKKTLLTLMGPLGWLIQLGTSVKAQASENGMSTWSYLKLKFTEIKTKAVKGLYNLLPAFLQKWMFEVDEQSGDIKLNGMKIVRTLLGPIGWLMNLGVSVKESADASGMGVVAYLGAKFQEIKQTAIEKMYGLLPSFLREWFFDSDDDGIRFNIKKPFEKIKSFFGDMFGGASAAVAEKLPANAGLLDKMSTFGQELANSLYNKLPKFVRSMFIIDSNGNVRMKGISDILSWWKRGSSSDPTEEEVGAALQAEEKNRDLSVKAKVKEDNLVMQKYNESVAYKIAESSYLTLNKIAELIAKQVNASFDTYKAVQDGNKDRVEQAKKLLNYMPELKPAAPMPQYDETVKPMGSRDPIADYRLSLGVA